VSHVEYAPTEQTDGQTDGRTSDRYITLTARRRQRNDVSFIQHLIKKFCYYSSATKVGALSNAATRPSVCLSVYDELGAWDRLSVPCS